MTKIFEANVCSLLGWVTTVCDLEQCVKVSEEVSFTSAAEEG